MKHIYEFENFLNEGAIPVNLYDVKSDIRVFGDSIKVKYTDDYPTGNSWKDVPGYTSYKQIPGITFSVLGPDWIQCVLPSVQLEKDRRFYLCLAIPGIFGKDPKEIKKYNEEIENFSSSIVNKELYGLKITDEMSKDLRNYIDNDFRLTKEDGSFDIEKIYSVAVWMKYGKDLVKANITKAKNEGREQVIKEVTNPSKNMTGGGRSVGSGLEAAQEAFMAMFPG